MKRNYNGSFMLRENQFKSEYFFNFIKNVKVKYGKNKIRGVFADKFIPLNTLIIVEKGIEVGTLKEYTG